MNKQDPQGELSRFESILTVRVPAASGVARALHEIYATKSAYVVLSCVRVLYPDAVETGRKLAQADASSLRPQLPSVDSVHSAVPRLLEAMALQDGNRAVEALGEMGVLYALPIA